MPDPSAESDDDDATRSLVRIEMPSPVLAAFDEALELFRALEGREATVTAFVEALVAEAASSGAPPESFDGAHHESLCRGEAAALRERALARSTNGWEHLGAGSGRGEAGPEWALHLAGLTLARLEALTLLAGRGSPSDLDAQIRELVALEDEIERRLAEVLVRMAESGAWMRLRFDSAVHYAEQRLGLGRTATRLRLRVVGALRRLPEVRRAYARGEMGAEAAWLVSRMIGPLGVDRSVEREWVERARLATVKRLRDEARLSLRRAVGLEEGPGGEHQREDGPADPAGGAPLERSPDESVGRPDVTDARRQVDPGADDSWDCGWHRDGQGTERAGCCCAWGVDLATRPADRARRGGPDTALPTGRLHVEVARGAGRAENRDGRSEAMAERGCGGPRPVTDFEWHASLHRRAGTARRRLARLGRMAAARMVSDVFLRLRLPAGLEIDLLGAIEAARRRLEQRAGEVPWEEPWPEPDPPGSMLAARERFVRSRRTPAWVGLLALLEDFVETWDVEHAGRRRAGQAIHERSGWRCSAPGCTSRKNLESHHIVYSGRGGCDDGWNRLSICRFHHQLGEHGELASVRGRAPLGVTWSLGRLACGGWFRNEMRLGAPEPGAEGTRGTLSGIV